MIDGPVIGGRSRQVVLSFALCTAVIGSVLAAPGAEGLAGAFLAAMMFAIAVVDSGRYLIPDELTAAALALALLRAGAIGPDADWQAVSWAVLRAAGIALPLLALKAGYRRWRGREGLGLGDIKLAGVAGAWLGVATIFAVIELAALSALGAYVARGYLRRRRLKATEFLPFRMFLAPAIWLGWLVEALLG